MVATHFQRQHHDDNRGGGHAVGSGFAGGGRAGDEHPGSTFGSRDVMATSKLPLDPQTLANRRKVKLKGKGGALYRRFHG